MDKKPDIYLPTLHSFAMNNIFTGSWGNFRFRIQPEVAMKTAKEVDFEGSLLQAACWHGIFCYEKSEIEEKATFPMCDEGLSQLKAWLESKV